MFGSQAAKYFTTGHMVASHYNSWSNSKKKKMWLSTKDEHSSLHLSIKAFGYQSRRLSCWCMMITKSTIGISTRTAFLGQTAVLLFQFPKRWKHFFLLIDDPLAKGHQKCMRIAERLFQGHVVVCGHSMADFVTGCSRMT